MNEIAELPTDKYRLLVALRYLNANEAIFNGLKSQAPSNQFHFLVTLRSLIEYNRRGIWFLACASDEKLKRAEHLTFREAGSPSIQSMDALVQEALGQPKASPLMDRVPAINEPFLNCLHALAHGNPISVRMVGIGIDRIFDIGGLLARAEMELNMFRILLYRRFLKEDLPSIWGMLSKIQNRPSDIEANARIAAHELGKSENNPLKTLGI